VSDNPPRRHPGVRGADERNAVATTLTETQRTAVLIQQTVMYSWMMNRLAQRVRVTAEDAWQFCLHGIGG